MPERFSWIPKPSRLPRLSHKSRRNEDVTIDDLIVYTNDVFGQYTGNRYVAQWSRTFFLMSSGDLSEFVYALDFGNNSRGIPVVYMQEQPDDLSPGTVTSDILLENGGIAGVLMFSNAGVLGDIGSLTLFTIDDNNVISELPPSAGGFVVPIVFADLSLDFLVEFLGSFGGSAFPWGSEGATTTILEAPDTFVLGTLGLDTIKIEIIATDEDIFDDTSVEGQQALYYEYTFPPEDSETEDPLLNAVPSAAPFPATTQTLTPTMLRMAPSQSPTAVPAAKPSQSPISKDVSTSESPVLASTMVPTTKRIQSPMVVDTGTPSSEGPRDAIETESPVGDPEVGDRATEPTSNGSLMSSCIFAIVLLAIGF